MTAAQQQVSEQSGIRDRLRSYSDLILPPFRTTRPAKKKKTDPVERAFGTLYKKIRDYLPRNRTTHILRAYRFAAHAHRAQKRVSGESYIVHPVAVATMVADMRLDANAVAAALLHDVIEDTDVTLDAIRDECGGAVAHLVEGLTKLRAIKQKPMGTRGITPLQSANYQKLVLAMARDLRVILIKLSDRLHNLRTIQALPHARRRKIAKETMLIYAPLAGRLGMEKIRMELEDLSFAAAYPMRYRLIKDLVDQARRRRKNYMEAVITQVRTCLKDKGITGKVQGRQKNLAGIYNKMTRRASEWLDASKHHNKEKHSLHEIMDVHGVRIVTKKIDDCYRALGVLHMRMRPVPGRFKDYIANPKKNGYQSLHTTLIGPSGYPLEVQIRTRDMNMVAESGIAAHFLYKAGFFTKRPNSMPVERSMHWLQSIASSAGEGDDLLNKLRLEFSPNEIYVYTPTGEIVSLLKGACAIDFAYAIHTDMGARCVACEIDNKPAPITKILETGQVIRIFTRSDASPDFSWSSYAVTPKALSHIAQYASMKHSADLRTLGRKMLANALHAYQPQARLDDISADRWRQYLQKHGLATRDAFYEALCLGRLTALGAAFALLPSPPAGPVNALKPSLGIQKRNSTVKYANCCRPIPGDRIVAMPIKQGGLHIHRAFCSNVKGRNKEHYLPAHWENEEGDAFLVALRCHTRNMPDVISKIVNSLTRNGVNVENIITEDAAVNVRILAISLWVRNRDHLATIVRKLRIVRDITGIGRIRN